jgi:hypothetical protein
VSAPFYGVKAFMDRMVARNCCIHIASASLDQQDSQLNGIRKQMVQAWVTNFGLPVGWIGPNVEANVRVDDRAITIPPDPDWAAIGKEAEKRLAVTWTLDDDTGCYVKRTDVVPVGTPVERYPEITDAPDDAPRAWSTPWLDIDIHRTVNPGWGSTREDPPTPGAVAAIQRWYDQGFQIQLSCAGWMRSTHTQAQSEQRLAAFRLYFRKYGIPYDRIVTKDDCDVFFDDKSITYTSWKQTVPIVDVALAKAAAAHPLFQLPGTGMVQSNNVAAADIERLGTEIKELRARLEAPKAVDKSPDIHIHLPEGMVNFADGAIRAESHFATPSGGVTKFKYDSDGRVMETQRS